MAGNVDAWRPGLLLSAAVACAAASLAFLRLEPGWLSLAAIPLFAGALLLLDAGWRALRRVAAITRVSIVADRVAIARVAGGRSSVKLLPLASIRHVEEEASGEILVIYEVGGQFEHLVLTDVDEAVARKLRVVAEVNEQLMMEGLR